jgi:hypothetical protein
LYVKIENVLPIIYATCMTNAFKEKWKWPVRDPKTGLYKDKYCKNSFVIIIHLVIVKKKKKDNKETNMDVIDGESPDKEKGIFDM